MDQFEGQIRLATADSFAAKFALLTGYSPFRWQRRLYDRFAANDLPTALDLPTGLGKTSVMAIWLLARDANPALPRRLVYVVDRRVVVDQATAEAEKLRENARAKLGMRNLPISTLRGQFADNREWLVDPARPAIIVGTIDMIGSRLLFEGYGVSRKMRPYQAGFLGADTLVVLDEAHLCPPFEALLRAIATEDELKPISDAHRAIVPAFRLLPLSATSRNGGSNYFRLEPEDADPVAEPVVYERFTARKRLKLHELPEGAKLVEKLAERAWELGIGGDRVLVYCDSRKDAESVATKLDAHSKGRLEAELLVGARRVRERQNAARNLREIGFIGDAGERNAPAFVVATSAGEVGIDIDADHMVCDLVAFERMVQRLGRVNRRGGADREAIVDVFYPPLPRPPDRAKYKQGKDGEKKYETAIIEHQQRTRVLKARLDALVQLPRVDDGRREASSKTLGELKAAFPKLVEEATTLEPLRPALDRAVVDAWSMTSLKEHPGRPEPVWWLRGWVEDDEPQTEVVWRTWLPVRIEGGTASTKEVNAFFDAAPPHISEKLETETWRVVDWLVARAAAVLHPSTKKEQQEEAHAADAEPEDASTDAAGTPLEPLHGDDIVAFALTPAGEVRGEGYRLDALAERAKDKKTLARELTGITLVVDARLGGLGDGLLNEKSDVAPQTADDGTVWLSDDRRSTVRFRVHPPARREPEEIERGTFAFATKRSPEGEDEEVLLIETWATEESRATSRHRQLLTEHQSWAERCASAIADGIGLSGDYKNALAIAARLHDEGKKSSRWQRAFNAPRNGEVYAKTKGPISLALLDGYRHEFGSLPFVEKDAEFAALPLELQDLVLHMVAAHHGRARPLIEPRGCEDAPPSVLAGRALDVALRFARLQRAWGPWGLAWWESLLRAADRQASRENDARAETGQLAQAHGSE